MAVTKTTEKPQNTALALPPEQRNQLVQIKAGIEQRMPFIRHLLPKHVSEEKFISTVLTAMANSKDGALFKCTPMSLLKAAVEAAELGLSLSPHRKECDIIPRWNGKISVLEAQLQPRYGGLMALAKRSGEVKSIRSEAVREGDIKFVWESGLNQKLEHIKKVGNTGKLIAAYCVWTLADGTKEFEVVEQEDIDRAKRASQSRNKEGELVGPWKEDEEEQWRKTAIRRASKYMPSSAEDFQRAVQMDTLRDIGHEVELQEGEVVDITEPAGPVNAPQQQSKQMDKLEEKVVSKKQPATPAAATAEPPKKARELTTIAPPQIDGQPDYAAWATAVVPLINGLTPEEKQQWKLRHQVFLEAAEFSHPDQIEPILKAVG